MVDGNPYAAPRADLDASPSGASGAFWRAGPLLVTGLDVTLPPRCVKCNAPLAEPLKRKRFYWHHPAVFALLLLNLLLYALVALLVRKRAEVGLGLCEAHARKRTMGILVGVGGTVLSLGLMFVGAAQNVPLLALAAIAGVVASIVAGAVMARTLLPTRIDRTGAQFKGCGEAFLAELPPR